MIENMKYIKP